MAGDEDGFPLREHVPNEVGDGVSLARAGRSLHTDCSIALQPSRDLQLLGVSLLAQEDVARRIRLLPRVWFGIESRLRRVGDLQRLGRAVNMLGNVAQARNDPEPAGARFAECIAIARTRRDVSLEAVGRSGLGEIELLRGKFGK